MEGWKDGRMEDEDTQAYVTRGVSTMKQGVVESLVSWASSEIEEVSLRERKRGRLERYCALAVDKGDPEKLFGNGWR